MRILVHTLCILKNGDVFASNSIKVLVVVRLYVLSLSKGKNGNFSTRKFSSGKRENWSVYESNFRVDLFALLNVFQ